MSPRHHILTVIAAMDWSEKMAITAFLIVAGAINGAYGYAMVSGTVFCDQCRDGQVSLFDYPLQGIKVAMACRGSDGQYTTWREETTNWLGNYVMRFDGTPNLNGCYAQVSGGKSGGCGSTAGPPKYVRQMFNMFDMEMYGVDPLVAQPAQPMSFCPRSNVPSPAVPAQPPPTRRPQFPPVPFFEASACSSRMWMRPEYRCYWKVVGPDTKVAVAFGLLAARRYGTDMTLLQGLTGRSDPYKTLLREGTTSLLNSYNSIQFPYHPLDVVERVNAALLGSKRQLLHTALRFMRANNGVGATNATCAFTTCK